MKTLSARTVGRAGVPLFCDSLLGDAKVSPDDCQCAVVALIVGTQPDNILSEFSEEKFISISGLAADQPSALFKKPQSVPSSMNAQNHLRWVWGSTALADALTANQPGLCLGVDLIKVKDPKPYAMGGSI